ncbi:MAG: helix-turn-helix transcriptional regulator [Bacteroidales bacterium]|nr:helix-turn-helix transcriptional regulator [Bacteroidales bacterium]
MLQYNFDRIFKAKGIEKPFSYLRQAGFSANFATKVKQNKINRLSLDLLERLCIALICTPNDFMEWTPDKNQYTDKNHPLYELKRADKLMDLTKTLNALSLSKLEELEKLIKDNTQESSPV